LMLWKKSGESWKDDELVPIESVQESKSQNMVIIKMTNGEQKLVEYY
jgi:hypothetical protein